MDFLRNFSRFIEDKWFIEETLASTCDDSYPPALSNWLLTNVESRIGDNVTNDDRPSPSFASTNLLITAYKPSIDSRLETRGTRHVRVCHVRIIFYAIQFFCQAFPREKNFLPSNQFLIREQKRNLNWNNSKQVESRPVKIFQGLEGLVACCWIFLAHRKSTWGSGLPTGRTGTR